MLSSSRECVAPFLTLSHGSLLLEASAATYHSEARCLGVELGWLSVVILSSRPWDERISLGLGFVLDKLALALLGGAEDA